MGAGDTISGKVRYKRLRQLGHENILTGRFTSAELDQSALADQLYVFPDPDMISDARIARAVREAMNAVDQRNNVVVLPPGDLEFGPQETLILEHKSASLSEAIDHDADEFKVRGILVDLNSGQWTWDTLDVTDQDLTSDPTSSTSSFVNFFEHQFGDGEAFLVAGAQKNAAVEAA